MATETRSGECREAAQRADREFMDRFNSGDIEGAAKVVYTEDAVILPPGGEIVRGRDNIADFWRAAAEQMGITKVDLSTVSFEQAGDHAHQIGRATLSLKDGSQADVKYVVVWKQENDAWKWHIDMWNSNT